MQIWSVTSGTAPLDALRGEDNLKSKWTPEIQQACNRIITLLQQGTFLHHADFNHKFYGASDASGSGIGGVVYQIIDNTTHYICFYSRSLSPSERNYSATKRELLGMIFTIRKGHSYFWGRRFTFYTDHAALTYIRTQPKLNAMITNWFEELLGYDMTIHHRPGVLNILPDHLSRLYPVQNTQYYPVLANLSTS